MRYLGGKSRIAKRIAAAMSPRGPWWEPFCGGLSVSVHLAKYGPGLVSDIHPALIALYRAVRAGWEPPTSLSREEYAAARELPDDDPLKAFAGFGCSFGGKWFGGYAAECGSRVLQTHSGSGKYRVYLTDQAQAVARALRRDLTALVRCELACRDFFEVRPECGRFETIYCDPPYAGGVTGYATGPFDHAHLWQRCAEWAAAGTRVFVSEYAAGGPSDVVMEVPMRDRLRGGNGAQALKVERLFYVFPSSSIADNDNGVDVRDKYA